MKFLGPATIAAPLLYVAAMFGVCAAQTDHHFVPDGAELNVWSTNGPAAAINTLEAEPFDRRVLYAGGSGSLYKSIDNGESWALLGLLPVRDLAADPINHGTLFAISQSEVIRTMDGGVHWDPIFVAEYPVSILVNPGTKNLIYMMSVEFMYVSTDGGDTWLIRRLPIFNSADAMAVHPEAPNRIFAYLTNFSPEEGIYRSDNSGASWQRLFSPGFSSDIEFDPENPDIVYAAGVGAPNSSGGVHTTTDGGENWTFSPVVENPIEILAVAVDPVNSQNVYAGTSGRGVFKSSDGGKSWASFTEGLTQDVITRLAFNRSGDTLHAGTNMGVFSARVRGLNLNSDFDGDGRSDIAVFRPIDTIWYMDRSAEGFTALQFGSTSDRLTPADYDGDGKTDIGVFREGVWYWLDSSNGEFNAYHFGLGSDIPVPADVSGDGRAELIVFREGIWWWVDLTNDHTSYLQFGSSADKPVPADYDGDGKTDPAVYRDGIWYLLQSTNGFAAIQFGLAPDKLVPADYDGDAKTDQAVYRDGTWYLLQSRSGFAAFQFGIPTDTPVPADYDGDGTADIAVFRDGVWYIQRSSGGYTAQQFGLADDRPVQASFLH